MSELRNRRATAVMSVTKGESEKNRVTRTKDDLKLELRHQVALLQAACASFDSGLHPSGKHIALSLRLLLTDLRRGKALLDQLGLRNGRFVDTAGDFNPANLIG